MAAWLLLAVEALQAAVILKQVRGQTLLERDGGRHAARTGEALWSQDRIVTVADGFEAGPESVRVNTGSMTLGARPNRTTSCPASEPRL